MNRTSLADSLRDARKAAGLSQALLAEQSGVGVSTIRDIEQGVTKSPLYSTVATLFAAISSYETDSPATTRSPANAVTGPTSGE